MILLTGATGTTGRDIVNELKNAGAGRVRVMVRDAARAGLVREAGFETVEGDFERPETLDAALAGVERALLLTPPSPRTFELQRGFIEAAKRAGVRHVVKLSAIGADASGPEGFGRWHGQAEETLKASGLDWTMLQPNFFMQNLLGQAQQMTASGAIYQATGDGRASMIDTRDIAAVAARALTEEGHAGKSYLLTGPEALSYRDAAERLSAVLGRGIKYVPLTPEQFREGARAQGLPDWLLDALERLNELFASGRAAAVSEDVPRVTGRPARTFDEFARDHVAAFEA
ncbi:MAG TPA: SDR family oxidoreductase [Pyrinomonadaceae bacterium]|jgi:uncharacterized protein YbjT (DUF2867 family)|nr:SDR family oxidoreductase [Pyrinomonadaceae bacterium]